MTAQSKGKVAEARAASSGRDELVAVAKSTGLSPRVAQTSVCDELSQTKVWATGGELRRRAPNVLRRESFSRLRGQSYALRLALFLFFLGKAVGGHD
jgi:hypothetical protein